MWKARSPHYDQETVKKHFGSAYLPQPTEDWDMRRRAKQICQTCQTYDPLMAGCKKLKLPGGCR